MVAPTFIDRDLTNQVFVRDLRTLLSQPSECLLVIADTRKSLGEVPGFQHAQRLRVAFDLSTRDALACVRIVGRIAQAIIQADITPQEAATQIAEIASLLDEPILVSEEQKQAIVSAISSEQEIPPLEVRMALADGPHFLDMNGNWHVSLIRLPDNTLAAVPVVALDVLWHDQHGTRHEAYFRLSEAEWDALVEKVAGISRAREDVGHLLAKASGTEDEEGS